MQHASLSIYCFVIAAAFFQIKRRHILSSILEGYIGYVNIDGSNFVSSYEFLLISKYAKYTWAYLYHFAVWDNKLNEKFAEPGRQWNEYGSMN